MSKETEDLLRKHLRSVESAVVPSHAVVGDGIARFEHRVARRRRVLASTTTIAIVALAVGFVWNTSASPQQITGADGVPSTTASLSTGVPPTTPVDTGPWTAIPGFAKPIAGATVVWTGTEALMIGGTYGDGITQAGIFAYNPTTSAWRVVSPDLTVGGKPLAFWTGTSLVLIGSKENDMQLIAVYDPYEGLKVTQKITEPTDLGLAYVDATVPWSWTGAELLVWPTALEVFPAPRPTAYDPATGESRPLAEIPLESRANAASVWTGTDWIIWGGNRGSVYFADGAAYNPTTDSWRLLPESPLSARRAPAVWTGTEMLVTAGFSGDPTSPFALADGAAYDPLTNTWRDLAPGLAHPGFVPVWTGELLVMFAKGGAVWFDPATDEWSSGDFTWGEVPHVDTSPVWTGEVVLLLGSYDGSTGGATFTPPTD